MSRPVRLSKPTKPLTYEVPLTSSKSESNRVLVIDHLVGDTSKLNNLSSARDTHTMQQLLHSNTETLDVMDAGTVMRFLTAYLAVGKSKRVITGTMRMCKRPIKLLVEALTKLGATIRYLKEEGFPPLEIQPIAEQKTNQLSIPGNVSSQYISALLMIAPTLPDGLRLQLKGEIYSRPYIEMTLNLMKHFGVEGHFEGNEITIKPQAYVQATYTVESDWSGASYWYSLVALADDASITLKGLKQQSNQGDSAVASIMQGLGVVTEFKNGKVILSKSTSKKDLSLDFRPCPDLAQTVIACAAAKGVSLKIKGLESLKIKETDRIAALTMELAKIGARLEEPEVGKWLLIPKLDGQNVSNDHLTFDTYDDHRMAMALAPLCMKYDITINEPDVVVKSYPEFWDHLGQAGIQVLQ